MARSPSIVPQLKDHERPVLKEVDGIVQPQVDMNHLGNLMTLAGPAAAKEVRDDSPDVAVLRLAKYLQHVRGVAMNGLVPVVRNTEEIVPATKLNGTKSPSAAVGARSVTTKQDLYDLLGDKINQLANPSEGDVDTLMNAITQGSATDNLPWQLAETLRVRIAKLKDQKASKKAKAGKNGNVAFA